MAERQRPDAPRTQRRRLCRSDLQVCRRPAASAGRRQRRCSLEQRLVSSRSGRSGLEVTSPIPGKRGGRTGRRSLQANNCNKGFQLLLPARWRRRPSTWSDTVAPLNGGLLIGVPPEGFTRYRVLLSARVPFVGAGDPGEARRAGAWTAADGDLRLSRDERVVSLHARCFGRGHHGGQPESRTGVPRAHEVHR